MESKSAGISIALIIKISGEEDLWKITKLDFYSKSCKIKRIENLERCPNLQELNLSYNYISKIENLNLLSKLKSLDLSENSIKRFENLSSLSSLEYLNLTGNLVKEIDKQEMRGLTSLSFLNISKNKIARISEFGNLEILKNLESLCTAGNLVKQSDLKEYLPIRIANLKYLDGESISHNPSENASAWVIKDKLKELKLDLIEKSKELVSLNKEYSQLQDSIKNIEKSAPDKKYMRELLDKADVLHSTSVNLQKTMVESRETLEKYNIRLERIRKEAKDTGNYIVEEITLADETKKAKEQIEELESQYGVVLEELELIAEEITKIDDIINNTPKFKSNEIINLESRSKFVINSMAERNKEIQDIKNAIEECNNALGVAVEAREFVKIMESVWNKISGELWLEESDDPIREARRWAAKVCECLDKERSEFAHLSSKTSEDVKKLEKHVEGLTKKLHEETKSRYKAETTLFNQKNSLEKKLKAYEERYGIPRNAEELQESFDIGNVQEQFNALKIVHSEKVKEITALDAMINERTNEYQDISNKLLNLQVQNQKLDKMFQEKYGNDGKNKGFDVISRSFSKLAQVLKVPMDISHIVSEVEVFCNKFIEFKEKYSRFKTKKAELIKSYQQKNQEIQLKIKEINKEKLEIESEKSIIKSSRETLQGHERKINEKESVLKRLIEEKNSAKNEKVKLEYQIETLKEECEAYNEKKFRLLSESQRLQDLFDSDMEKYDELIKRLRSDESRLGEIMECYRNAVERKENAAIAHEEILEEIKSNEDMLYYLKQKISEEQVKLRTELENQVKITKQREQEIQELNVDIVKKEKEEMRISKKLEEKKTEFKKIQKESKFIQDKSQEYNTRIIEQEQKIDNIDKINQKLVEEMRNKQNQLQSLEEEVRNKHQRLEMVQNYLNNELRNKEKITESENKLDELSKMCNLRKTELSKLNENFENKLKYSNQIEEIARSHESLRINKFKYEPGSLISADDSLVKSLNEMELFSNEFKIMKEMLLKTKDKKHKILKEISLITSEFNSKEAFYNERLGKLKKSSEVAEHTLENLKKNIETLTFDLNIQAKALEKVQSELASLISQKELLTQNCKFISEEVNSQKNQLDRLKIQEKESLVILALSGFEIDQSFRDRISKFASSLNP